MSISHKAGKSFFDCKREWSRRKDQILAGYLAPYLPKIATQGRPVLLVDAFAGPGKFGDNEPGSPLIVCQAVRKAMRRKRGLPVTVRVIATESDRNLHRELNQLLEQFDFAEAVQVRFTDFLPRIIKHAEKYNVFLYVDPFTVEGLDWAAMDELFTQLSSGISIEILLNFNAPSFVRRGLAALRLGAPKHDPKIEDLEPFNAEAMEPASAATLSSVVGGNWWEEVLRSTPGYPEQVAAIATKYCRLLKKRFKEVCYHPMKASPRHLVPKYYLIFASRHPHALRLMNDEMVKSLRKLAEMARPKEPTLFETRPEDLVPDRKRIPAFIVESLRSARPRGDVITDVIRKEFGHFSWSEIRGEIELMLRAGTLQSGKGHWRINDDCLIWCASR